MTYRLIYRFAFGASVVLGCSGTLARAEDVNPRIGQIKAAIVYNIAKFVEWPNSTQPLEICIQAHDPLKPFIESVTEDKEVKGRQINIRVVDLEKISREQKSVCHILFIGDGLNEHKKNLNAFLTKQGLLTICDVRTLSWDVCSAQIFEDNNKARIAIDKELLEKAGLRISSELLDLAILKPTN